VGYALILGEALIDLLEAETDGEPVYRPVVGGAPLNVAVGVARLGGRAEFAGALGDDSFAERIIQLMAESGTAFTAVRRVAAPTALAVTSFSGAEPAFRFYGEPPSYAKFRPEDVDAGMVGAATVLYAGSISLLRQPFRTAAWHAWETPGPVKVFDPNIRPGLLPDTAAVARSRDQVEQFAATADLVKLSSADAAILYPGMSPQRSARRLRDLGAGTVVVTCGAQGAWLDTDGGTMALPSPTVTAVDATGAGDSVMAALIHRLLQGGVPTDVVGWRPALRFALAVAGLVCEKRGGATAMPSMKELMHRWGPLL
jgi:fructokinase